RRADVDAQIASRLLGTAVGADGRLVVEEFRLLELAHRERDLGDRGGLRDRIGPRTPVALRRLVHAQVRLATQIEDQIEALAASDVAPVEIDGSDRAARRDALSMGFAAVEIDFMSPIAR